MLDFKDNYILKQLVETNTVFTIFDLQKTLGISQRSIYYSIERINDYLISLDLPIIINKRGVGLIVDGKVIEHLNRSKETIINDYICTNQERNNLQVIKIILKKDHINISSLMKEFNVSRSTIIKDLREIRNIISFYQLTLEYNIERGYEIIGKEIQKRSLLLSLSSTYNYLLEIEKTNYYHQSDVEKIIELIQKVEEKLDVIYVRNTLQQVAVLLAIIKKNHLKEVLFEENDNESFYQTAEYQAVKEVFNHFFDQKEFLYVVLHLLALRVQYSGNTANLRDDEYLLELVNFMINEFYNLTLINFKNKEELINNLYMHMKPALFRFKYGINYRNELKEQIINEFFQVYRITKVICTKLEKIIDHKISEDEISYVAIHYGALIEKEQQIIAHPKILLVCLNGKALVRNLRRELESFTKDVEIIDAYRMQDVISLKDQVEYIVTTEPLKDIVTKAKTLVINPILNDRERYKMINFLGLSNVTIYNIDTVNKIMKDIESYIDESKYDEVKDIIKGHLKK